jgi:hypothetical protein
MAHASRTLGSPSARATAPPPAITHQLPELLALRGGNRIAHVQTKINPGFLDSQLRRADFLQLGVDCGAIGFFCCKQVSQIDPFHLEIGSLANFGFAEVGHLFANSGCLFLCDANLLPNGGVIQKPRETKLASPHATASVEAAASMTPSAWVLVGAHLAAWPKAVARSLLVRRRILRAVLSEKWRAAKC